MHDEFGTIVIVVGIVGAVIATLSYIGSGRIYKTIGKGQFALDTPDRVPGPQAGSAAARAEQEAEVRQLIQAKSDRREARGEAPLDVEAEVQALLRPAAGQIDPELREEIRQLVIARNERRERRGEPPLDVEAEIERQIRALGA
jgi:hypothetical protein